MKLSLISTNIVRRIHVRPILLAALLAAAADQVHAQQLFADVNGVLSITSSSFPAGGADVITATLFNSAISTETASDIDFTDVLPSGLTPMSLVESCGSSTMTGQAVTYIIASLSPGAACTLQIHITSELAGIYSDTGTFSTSTLNAVGGTTGSTNSLVPIDVTASVDSVPPVSSAPEPGVWALMLAGFGGLGAAMRMRRRRVTA